MASLAYFSAEKNRLTGTIPRLNDLTSLLSFDVSDNILTGSIPPVVASSAFSKMIYMDVSNNNLTGAFIDSWPYTLKYMDASNNALTCMELRYSGAEPLDYWYDRNSSFLQICLSC